MKSPPRHIFPLQLSARCRFTPNRSNLAIFQNTIIFFDHCEAEKENIILNVTHSIPFPPIAYIQDPSQPRSSRPEVVQAELSYATSELGKVMRERRERFVMTHLLSSKCTWTLRGGKPGYLRDFWPFLNVAFTFTVFRHLLPGASDWTAYQDPRTASPRTVFKWHDEYRPVTKRGISGAKGEPSKTGSKQNSYYRSPPPTRHLGHTPAEYCKVFGFFFPMYSTREGLKTSFP